MHINLVLKLTVDDLLNRLKETGTREPSYTKNLIKKKLSSDDVDHNIAKSNEEEAED